ncbi:MAG: recombination mediator RecR [Sphingobacteriales bacterium JAD_PAG50586_3]|nr:MAG: recombination mediator RecR [Sphingobacteriales bacterium JAD_PAG50586_3]
MDQYPSKLIEDAVNAMSSLPGVGKRTALRLVLNLLKREPGEVENFATAFTRMRNEIKYCTQCHNIADVDLCAVCADTRRDTTVICVVENLRDVMAIENTLTYRGVYHLLGGIISPMDGIGPADLNIDSLVSRVGTGHVNEVILALSATMEGDTTNFYIFKKLSGIDVKITTIARGVPVGDELEYTDEVTLGRSIANRIMYENNLAR